MAPTLGTDVGRGLVGAPLWLPSGGGAGRWGRHSCLPVVRRAADRSVCLTLYPWEGGHPGRLRAGSPHSRDEG